MSITYYDRNGDPLPDEWILNEKYFGADPTSVRVARTKVGDVEVSTVWLGLNHSHVHGAPPLYFETMLFCDDDDDTQQNELTRYGSEEEAMRGHLAAVDALRAGRSLGWWA